MGSHESCDEFCSRETKRKKTLFSWLWISETIGLSQVFWGFPVNETWTNLLSAQLFTSWADNRFVRPPHEAMNSWAGRTIELSHVSSDMKSHENTYFKPAIFSSMCDFTNLLGGKTFSWKKKYYRSKFKVFFFWL